MLGRELSLIYQELIHERFDSRVRRAKHFLHFFEAKKPLEAIIRDPFMVIRVFFMAKYF